MSARQQTGFTIIEVMLFLGITGLIMAFMLNGVGSQLNQQRYQDATTSLVSYFQEQYNLTSNVNNTRNIVLNGCGDSTTAGTSDCTIVGRVLYGSPATAGGETTTIASTWVIAKNDVALINLNNKTDTQVLQEAGLVALSDVDQYEAQWGTKLIAASTHTPLTFSMLIVRMPTSGAVRTYVDGVANRSPMEIVTSGAIADLKVCLDPAGLLGTGSVPSGVVIRKDTANSGGVELVGQGDC